MRPDLWIDALTAVLATLAFLLILGMTKNRWIIRLVLLTVAGATLLALRLWLTTR